MADTAPLLHRGDGAFVKCGSCPTMIVFAGNPSTGKLAPYEVDAAGNWVLRNGLAVHVNKVPPGQGDLFAEPEQRYTNHFARCPAAAEYRKDKPRG